MAKLLFTRRAQIGSTLIRAVTWSGWSHVQCYLDDSTLIGAGWPNGVDREPLAARLAVASVAVAVSIPIPDEPAYLAFLKAQMGKPYDLVGMLGLAIHREWQNENSWWCSELAAAAVQEGGLKIFRDEAIKRITPQDIWMLPFASEVLK